MARSDSGLGTGARGKERVKHGPHGQLVPLFTRLSLMHYSDRHATSVLLLTAAALALVLGGCAVPVTDGYGYESYEGYGPAYPSAIYGTPVGPPVIYGGPPAVFGGQIWIDSTRRPPPRWRDEPRWRENRHERRREFSRPDGDDRWQQRRPHERSPDARQRPGPSWQERQDRQNPPNRDRGPRGGRDSREFP